MAQTVFNFSDIIDVRLVMSEVASQAQTQLSSAMGRWVKTMNRQVTSAREKELRKIHRDTANAARQAIIAAYNSSGIGEGRSYRQSDPGKLRRYSNGAMDRALRNKKLITGDSTGIQFIDKDILDRSAKQWYRLNFGASPKGSKNPAVGSMKFFGRASSQRAALLGYKPSKAFRVPSGGAQGFWSTTYAASGSQPLKPAQRGQRGALYIRTKRTKFQGKVPATFFRGVKFQGIEGKRFLDAGAREINRVYPKLLTEMIKNWEINARKSMK